MIRWLATLACLCATPAGAQVFEVGDDGALREVAGATDAAFPEAPLRPQAAAAGGIGEAMDAPAPPPAYRDAVFSAARANGLSPWLVDAVARSESGYDPDAVSAAGALGIMQLMPATARELGVDPRDPAQNIAGGARYLRRMLDRFDDDLEQALAAYNAGSGSVLRHGGVPPFRETRAYVRRNLDRLASAAGAVAPAAAADAIAQAPPLPSSANGGLP